MGKKTGERVDRVCKNCGKSFEILKCKLKTNASGNFCCRQCYNLYLKTLKGEKNKSYNRISHKCNECGKELKIIPAKMKEYKKHFCSLKCRSEHYAKEFSGEKNSNWKGGHKKRKGDFVLAKRKYFKGKQFCAICGTTKNIHIHHIIPYRYTEDNSKSNLIPLCRSCHRKVEIITWDLIDEFEKEKYMQLKFFLNSILRTKQMATYCFIKEFIK